jgi:hypothetical protein
MNALAERYADRGVGSIFFYTHEAHPGEYYPCLTSIEQKFKHARDLRDTRASAWRVQLWWMRWMARAIAPMAPCPT